MPEYFTAGSADAVIAESLRDGDVVLVNRRCASLLQNPVAAVLCAASKYGLSGEGRHCWDHAAIVVRDRGVPYLLEGGASGVTMRTYEERLMQGKDHQEVMLLPLRTAASGEGEERRRASALAGLVQVCMRVRTVARALPSQALPHTGSLFALLCAGAAAATHTRRVRLERHVMLSEHVGHLPCAAAAIRQAWARDRRPVRAARRERLLPLWRTVGRHSSPAAWRS